MTLLGKTVDGIFCVPHVFRSANSSSRSVYPFTAGSFAILSASSIAATVSLLGWLREMSKGIRPSRRDWRTKILNAVVRFMPSSPNSLLACAFRSESIAIDSRYRSRKPLIVTTNLNLEEIKNPPDLAHGTVTAENAKTGAQDSVLNFTIVTELAHKGGSM